MSIFSDLLACIVGHWARNPVNHLYSCSRRSNTLPMTLSVCWSVCHNFLKRLPLGELVNFFLIRPIKAVRFIASYERGIILDIIDCYSLSSSVSDPDPLHLAGSTSIPAPDPDPDPLRFLSSDPDPLKKALIWIRVAPKLFRVISKTKCICYLRNAFYKF